MDFANKTILLTGASSGIGKALVEKLSQHNCNLAIIARREEVLNELKDTFSVNGTKILSIKCDVSVKEEVKNSYDEIKNEFGLIDLAILNSGVGFRMGIDDYNSELARKTFDVNFMGVVYWVEALLPDFIERGVGTIAGVSSLADNRGYSKSGFYCASKAALTTYLEGLAVELHPYNIKVITIKPGFVKTPMTDVNEFEMPFLMSPEKSAEHIIKGLRKGKRFIEYPFPTKIGSKIIGMLPNRFFEWLARKKFG